MIATRCLVLALIAAACTSAVTQPGAALRFSAPEGHVLNEFFRQGPVAAHLVLTSGAEPRVVFAFPAGNSGAALWFDAGGAALAWQPQVTMNAAERRLPDGRVLHGVTANLTATGGTVSVTQAIVGSVRVIRDYEQTRSVPSGIGAAPQLSQDQAVWQRERIDGAAGYYLSVEVLSGALAGGATRSIVFSPDDRGRLRLRVTALTGDTPLTPVAGKELLTAAAANDAGLRSMLEYLSFREKLLAGSWRFNTYFGRDTLMSLRLLAPVLQPQVAEAGLGSVLERLNARGEVAHEEDIGEYAVLRRRRENLAPGEAPIYDYKMIDDDFMLAVVAANYLLETPEGRARASGFLTRQLGHGETSGTALVRNFRFVVDVTAPFAREPDWRRLIALRPGQNAGNWRDSEEGLGGGRYPYDVNGVFAPAALVAIARLHASGLLRPYLDSSTDEKFAEAAAMAETWLREAPGLFDVEVAPDPARTAVREYARSIGVEPAAALAAIGDDAIRFRAVALDEMGRPIPVLNSDEAFALLFLDVAPAEVERIADLLTRLFPTGLLTGVGLLVANPAYAPEEMRPVFDRNRYHGAVIWSWQQAMFAAGVERQLGRDDLTGTARAALVQAQTRLRDAIDAAAAMRGSELWSWSQTDGAYRVETFGQRLEHETESNAAQLWSTVHLARPPR